MQEFAKDFYSPQAWRDTREAYKKSVGGLCERCYEKGLAVPGVIVHHVIPIQPSNVTDPEITLSWNNLMLVCRDCHAEIHQPVKSSLRYKVGPNGEVILV